MMEQPQSDWVTRRHDILNGLILAKGHAGKFIEERPDQADAARKLIDEIERAWNEFSGTVRAAR
jgi:hypothetical protein